MKKKFLVSLLIIAFSMSISACKKNSASPENVNEPEAIRFKTTYSNLAEFIDSINWTCGEIDLDGAGYTESAFPEENFNSEYFNKEILIESLGNTEAQYFTAYYKFSDETLSAVELYFSPQNREDYIEKFNSIYEELNMTEKFEKHIFFAHKIENEEPIYSELSSSDSISETNSKLTDAIGASYTEFLYKLYFSSDELKYNSSSLTGSSTLLSDKKERGYSISYTINNTENIPDDITEYETRETLASAENDSTEEEQTDDTSYQSILDEYSKKLKEATPGLVDEYKNEAAKHSGDINKLAEISNDKVGKLAEISNEGIGEMANIMYLNGDDYDTYEEWSQKLMDVYTEYAEKIMDAYIDSAT